MFTAQYYIEKLNMEPHMEGGYFKECLLSREQLPGGERNLWSSIYFLLQEGEASHLHVLGSDEVWYYHDGNPLTIYMISPEGEMSAKRLGLNIEAGEQPQIVVPKGYIFGSRMESPGYSLVGCMVSPCFKYEEFKLLERGELLEKYPQYTETIIHLTRE